MAKLVSVGTPTTTTVFELKQGTLFFVGSPPDRSRPGMKRYDGAVSLIDGSAIGSSIIVTPLQLGQTITLAQE